MKQEDTNRSTMNIQWYPGHMTKTRPVSYTHLTLPTTPYV